jgi:outer membrane protein TolC
VTRPGSLLKSLALSLLVVVSAGRVSAQTSSAAPAPPPANPAVRDLTLDDALTLAKKRNYNLVAEHERLAQAQTNITSAWATLLPTIAAQGRYTRNYAEFSFPSTSWTA